MSSRRFAVGPFKVTPSLLERLNSYAWPGNVRELENAIESAVALSHGNELDLSLLPEAPAGATASSAEAASSPAPAPAAAATEQPATRDLKVRTDAYERGLIVSALEEAHGNRSLAARMLGINRATLHGKLRKYGLSASDTDLDD
jgi:two-component system response regulator HydG